MKSEIITNNGLKLLSIKTESKPVNNINMTDFKILNKFLSDNFKEKGIVAAYLDYAILIRKFDGEGIILMTDEQPFDPKFIQKFRLFNKNKELYIWRTQGKWKARLRTDNENETGEKVIETNQVMFGTTASVSNAFTTLTETRGTEITLPFEIKNIDDKKNRVKIKTRNYIAYNEIGQAGFNDCRFVEFTFGLNNTGIGGN